MVTRVLGIGIVERLREVEVGKEVLVGGGKRVERKLRIVWRRL